MLGSATAADVSESSTGCHGAITRPRHHEEVMRLAHSQTSSTVSCLVTSLVLLSLAAWSSFR
jgi:hypothetical protein